MFRSLLRKAIAAVRSGDDPKGIFRDAAQARFVVTSAGSAVGD
jgi:hypothetical protein